MEVEDKLNRLIERGKEVLSTRRPPPSDEVFAVLGPDSVDEMSFNRWRRQTVHYLQVTFGTESPYIRDFQRECKRRTPQSVSKGLSILEEIKEEAPETVSDSKGNVYVDGSTVGILNAGEISNVNSISTDVSGQTASDQSHKVDTPDNSPSPVEGASFSDEEKELLVSAHKGITNKLEFLLMDDGRYVQAGDKAFNNENNPDNDIYCEKYIGAFRSLRERGYIYHKSGLRYRLHAKGIQEALKVVEEWKEKQSTPSETNEMDSVEEAIETESTISPHIENLMGQLKHSEMYTRKNAAMTFRSMAQQGENLKPVLPALIEALDDTDDGVYQFITEALGYMREDAVDAVPKLIQKLSPMELTRAPRAADTLRKIGTPKALQAVEEWERKRPRRF